MNTPTFSTKYLRCVECTTIRASLRMTPFITAHERDHARVAVEPRVDDQRLQRRVDTALRRGNSLDDALEQLVDAEARLRR